MTAREANARLFDFVGDWRDATDEELSGNIAIAKAAIEICRSELERRTEQARLSATPFARAS